MPSLSRTCTLLFSLLAFTLACRIPSAYAKAAGTAAEFNAAPASAFVKSLPSEGVTLVSTAAGSIKGIPGTPAGAARAHQRYRVQLYRERQRLVQPVVVERLHRAPQNHATPGRRGDHPRRLAAYVLGAGKLSRAARDGGDLHQRQPADLLCRRRRLVPVRLAGLRDGVGV
eukprot:ctg_875.g512